MAISIDTVYQRVLALANKEQRGYITPQEFNLFANQAQVEIFEQYFYDLNQVARIPGNDYVYADADDMLEEKLQIFEHCDNQRAIHAYAAAPGSGVKYLPDYIYRIHRIELSNVSCEILRTKDFKDLISAPYLIKSSKKRPVANIRNNIMTVMASGNSTLPSEVCYFKKPMDVRWGYVVVTGKALYDSLTTINFELHASEQSELVYKILRFAGVSMKRDDIMRAGVGMELAQTQQEKQ